MQQVLDYDRIFKGYSCSKYGVEAQNLKNFPSAPNITCVLLMFIGLSTVLSLVGLEIIGGHYNI